MRNFALIGALFTVLLSAKTYAQEATTSTELKEVQTYTESGYSNTLGTSVLYPFLNGFGLNYQHAFTNRFSFGPYVNLFRLEPALELFADTQVDVLSYGLESRFYFSGFNRSGVYLGLAVSQIEAKGKSTVDPLFSNDRPSATDRDTSTGYLATLGLNILARPIQNVGRLYADLSLGYGTGYEISTRTSSTTSLTSSSSNSTANLDIEIKEGMHIGALIGLMF